MRIGTHNGGWAVFAEWYGEWRPVWGGRGVSNAECRDYVLNEMGAPINLTNP